MVSLEEVYNITFSPLVTTLFSVQWTSNNCICIITEKGIHVFVSKNNYKYLII